MEINAQRNGQKLHNETVKNCTTKQSKSAQQITQKMHNTYCKFKKNMLS